MSGGEAGASSETTARDTAGWSTASGAPVAPPPPSPPPPPGPWRTAGPAWVDHHQAMARLEAGRRQRRTRARLAVGLSGLAIALVLVAVVVSVALVSPDAFEVARSADPSVREGTVPDGWDGDDQDDTTRLSPVLDLPSEVDGAHGFLQTELDGDPVTWDPCEPIRYVVNRRAAPPGADDILDRAVTAVEEASGLVFERVGDTDEEPPVGDTAERPQQDAARYGDDWSPVLIAWTDVATDPSLAGYAGIAQTLAVPYRSAGEGVYVTGMIRLLGDHAATAIEAGYTDDIVSVAMHELGHLVGLAHVGDPREVMNDLGDQLPVTWGPGDRAGLAALGAGECAPGV